MQNVPIHEIDPPWSNLMNFSAVTVFMARVVEKCAQQNARPVCVS